MLAFARRNMWCLSFATVYVFLVASVSGSDPLAQMNGDDMDAWESVSLLQVEATLSSKSNISIQNLEKPFVQNDEAPPATTEAPYPIPWLHINKPAFLDRLNCKAVAAEYLAMTLFVTVGCGSAMGIAKEPGWILQVALSFGLAMTVLGYALGHYSGGHINCAITFGLYMAGQVEWFQGICIFLAQLLGSVTGACILQCVFPQDQDRTQSLGSNKINEGFNAGQVLLGEGMMTFLLVFVVLETAVNPAFATQRILACLAIGLAVFLAHTVLLPVDGCSINPTRSFGPALIASYRKDNGDLFQDMWVFWLGPLAGASLAAFAYCLLES